MTFTLPTGPANPQTALFDDTKPDTPTAIARANQRTGWSATYSPCTRFRYLLYRPLAQGGNKGRILWCMMNPSTATEFKNDPTIAKCMAFSELWGYCEIEIVNIFALRSPKPKSLSEELANGGNPIGEENERHILEAAQRAECIVYACGVPPFGKRSPAPLRDRPRIAYELLRRYSAKVQCLAITKDGNPYHPLYLPLQTTPIPFNGWTSDDPIIGYTLALQIENACAKGTSAEVFPGKLDDGTMALTPEPLPSPWTDPSTTNLVHAQWWPTVTEAIRYREQCSMFADAEVKVIKKRWGREAWGLRAESLSMPTPANAPGPLPSST